MNYTDALDVVSEMVLRKISTRPALITRWGQLLKLMLEEYPECRTGQKRPTSRHRSAIELLRTIRYAGDVEMDDFSNEFWEEVDEVIKADSPT